MFDGVGIQRQAEVFRDEPQHDRQDINQRSPQKRAEQAANEAKDKTELTAAAKTWNKTDVLTITDSVSKASDQIDGMDSLLENLAVMEREVLNDYVDTIADWYGLSRRYNHVFGVSLKGAMRSLLRQLTKTIYHARIYHQSLLSVNEQRSLLMEAN